MCDKYKKLIMESIDDEILKNDNDLLHNHMKTCLECSIYFKKMQKMKKITSSMIYDAPPFIEDKIMSKINEKMYKQPIFIFNFKRVFAYAVSFCFILFISIFIVYNKFDNTIIKLSDLPIDTKIQVSKNVTNSELSKNIDKIDKREEIKIQKEDILAIEKLEDKKEIITQVPEIPEIQEKELRIASNPTPVINEKNQIQSALNYNVKKIDTVSHSISAAKITPMPTTPYNPLLAQDKAIVANNVINPLQGDKAIIRFVVDDTAFVKIVIYDKNIRVVSKILNEEKERGIYEVTWEGRKNNNELVSEGVYFVYIQIGTKVIKRNIIVNK